jgi:hypothetical protein
MSSNRENHAYRFLEDLENTIDSITGEQKKCLEGFMDIQVIRRVYLQHEIKRITAKSGKENPRLSPLHSDLRYNWKLIDELEVDLELSNINIPEFLKEGGLIHGRVKDLNNRGIDSIKVIPENDKNEKIDFLDVSITDHSGYYAIPLTPEDVGKLQEVEGGIYLSVYAPNRELMHRESNPLTVNPNDKLLREVTLDRSALFREGNFPGSGTSEARKNRTHLPGLWVVSGKVTDKRGEPIEGLMVSAYDKDVHFDDLLGAGLTDENGYFKIRATSRYFREGKEHGPDLYVKVTDSQGNQLFTSEESIRFNAGNEEEYNIQIPDKEENE